MNPGIGTSVDRVSEIETNLPMTLDKSIASTLLLSLSAKQDPTTCVMDSNGTRNICIFFESMSRRTPRKSTILFLCLSTRRKDDITSMCTKKQFVKRYIFLCYRVKKICVKLANAWKTTDIKVSDWNMYQSVTLMIRFF